MDVKIAWSVLAVSSAIPAFHVIPATPASPAFLASCASSASPVFSPQENQNDYPTMGRR